MKKIFALIITLALVVQTVPAAFADGESGSYVNGESVYLAACVINGESYVKLTDLGTALERTGARFAIETLEYGLNLNPGGVYAETFRTKPGSEPDEYFEPVPNDRNIYVNGVLTVFSSYFINGASYYLLRELAPQLGFSVTQSGNAEYITAGKDAPSRAGSASYGGGYYSGDWLNGAPHGAGVLTAPEGVYSGYWRNGLRDGRGFNLYKDGSKSEGFYTAGKAEGYFALTDPAGKTSPRLYEGGKPVTGKLSSVQISAYCADAVFFIATFDEDGEPLKTGSGFFIDAHGTAATNFHVLEGAYSASIVTNEGRVFEIEGVYDFDAAHDSAALKIDCESFHYLELGDSAGVKQGERVYAFGSPYALLNTMSDGIISNVRRVVGERPYIQITAPISQGSSGGPLINETGKVVGITGAQFVSGQNLNLAMPINRVAAMRKSGKITPLEELSESYL